MKKIVIYGAGGLAKEVALLIETINEKQGLWELIGYLEDSKDNIGKIINGYPVLGGLEWLDSYNEKDNINIVLGVGSAEGKKGMYEKLRSRDWLTYPNLIHPNVNISKYNTLGKGNIICEGSILTCDIEIDDFVTININSTIGHDTVIGRYSTISPNCSISGNVRLKEGVYFGTNATIIEKLTVGEHTIVGAGSLVVRDLPEYCTAVGVPAKPIKYHNG